MVIARALLCMILILTLSNRSVFAELSKSQRDELFERVESMCRDASNVGEVLEYEGSLQAGATLRIAGLDAVGKVTKEQWENIEQKFGEFRTNKTICRFEMIKMLVPLFGQAPTIYFQGKRKGSIKVKQGPKDLLGRVIFDYSTYNGKIIVGKDPQNFVLSFSKCSDSCIYMYSSAHKNGLNIKRLARIKDSVRQSFINISNHDSTSSSYTIRVNEHVILENSAGYFMQLRIISISDETRGGLKDEVVLDYEINTEKTGTFRAL